MLIIHPVEKFFLRLVSNCPFYSLQTRLSSFLGGNQASICPSSVLSTSSIFCALSEVSVSSSATHLQVLQSPQDVIYTWTLLGQPCALSSSFISLACQFPLTKDHSSVFVGISFLLTKTKAEEKWKILLTAIVWTHQNICPAQAPASLGFGASALIQEALIVDLLYFQMPQFPMDFHLSEVSSLCLSDTSP